MPDQASRGHGESHFVVLPDHEAALAVARRINAPGTFTHASGRPWLVGRWRDDEITVAAAGDVRLAVIGWCPAGAAELERVARDPSGIDDFARRLPGSFHLVASLGGRCRVQGTASGLRLVFHRRIDGVVVAADRADVLGDAPIDERALAVRLLFPTPHPLLERTMWRGVECVPPGSALVIDGERARLTRWWRAPEPVRGLAESVEQVKDALITAVDVRTRQGGAVACDLSGGLDSTSITFLAARSDARIVASTWPSLDPLDEDVAWARRAAAHLPQVDHVVWPAERIPLVYENLLGIDDPMDEPTIGVMDRQRLLEDLKGLADKGCRVRLTGIGGDHVAWCSEAHYHSLLRRRPLFAIRQLRAFRALFHWPLRPMIAALADSRSYGAWLADEAEKLRAPRDPNVTGTLGWATGPRLFDWVTPEAHDLARDALREAATTAEPLGRTRGVHGDLEPILSCSRIIRQWEQMSARAGLPIQSPFLDDRVIEACLAVRPEERVTPWHYKPVLTEAMRGIVPDECLARTNKAQASLEASAGLRRHRGDLVELWEGSKLADLGLVDRRRLTELALRPDTPELRSAILYSTIGCEVWLRSLDKGAEHAAAR
ncbi:lasso peptide isopeptide bond-forming cyclase [Lentzea flava]|uniref:asparagine synthase (glutamine-hydrolyzing) n=1 Tax=Lentzea flava TaxID=103732 RepID=A0ABQ2V5Q5_9PSEU|nr:lasso peptide isopeptide bond-forming cyclase [Lentzea flava]MCP2203659.1 asparagine synthase (glutamine-hydrolyzing) [Lentzea flava]GGU70062.1 asparagine synthase [Lentzea flava]